MKKAGKRGRMKKIEGARSAGSARKTSLERREGGSGKVLKRREKWQTLSCHKVLDVFILPQAVLEERSLREVRARLRARARMEVSRNPLNSYVTRARCVRRTPASISGGPRRLPAASPKNSRNRIPFRRTILRFLT